VLLFLFKVLLHKAAISFAVLLHNAAFFIGHPAAQCCFFHWLS
jgi:hypothetical protein